MLRQAGPGNDINAGSLGAQKAPTWSPASLVTVWVSPTAFEIYVGSAETFERLYAVAGPVAHFQRAMMMDIDQAAKAMRDEEMLAEIEDFIEGFARCTSPRPTCWQRPNAKPPRPCRRSTRCLR